MQVAPLDCILAAFLGSQLFLSMLYQFPRLSRGRLGYIAVVGALPTWSFFAPRPGTSDYRLLYREGAARGMMCMNWDEIDVGWKATRLVRCIWNPEKIGHKALCDCVQILITSVSELSQERRHLVFVSRAYLTLLSYVISKTTPATGTFIQFAVVESNGVTEGRSINPVFLSRRHKV